MAEVAIATTPESRAAADLRRLHELLDADEARRVKALAAALADFCLATDKAAAGERARITLEEAGVKGVTLPSLYRKAALWRAGGILSLVDGRVLRRHRACGLAENPEFVAWWHTLVLSNRRKTAPAYRALFEMIRAGEKLPGIGDWRDIWAAEHGGVRPAEDAACPYMAYSVVPTGFSIRNLTSLKPTKFALAAARQGTMAAQMQYLPTTIRTRNGLAPCACVQIDDMWHEVKVAFEGNRHAQRVADFSMIDVLTGHILGWLSKPVRERDDGTREVLRQEWVNYFIAHLLCDIGIPAGGCLIMGEHGTATADKALEQTLSELTGGAVRFQAGSVLSTALAKGLYDGSHKGNPRFKGMLEGLHALIKNELGAVRGHIGGGRGVQPEDAYGMDREDERLRAIARTLERSRPGALDRMRLPYMPWQDYFHFVQLAYDAVDTRTWHHMEDWEACGFVTGEWRPSPDQAWMPMSSLDRMDAKAAAAFRALIAEDERLYRSRRMSPREAFASRQGELQRLDSYAAPLIMGERLGRLCTVSDRLQIRYKDETTLRDFTIAAVLDGGRTLDRGEKVMVWHNPLNPDIAYISAPGGRFLGTAPVQIAAPVDDAEAMHRQLGIRQRALSEEMRKLTPYIRRKQAERAEADRVNALSILGEDPLEREGALEAAGAAMERARPVDTDELLPVAGADGVGKGFELEEGEII